MRVSARREKDMRQEQTGSDKERIGLIGVGLVGTALAEHLLADGFGVVGFDIDRSRRDALTALGGVAVNSPREVGERTRRTVLSLMTSEIVRSVLEGPDGLLSASRLPEVIIDTTTGDPDATVATALRLAERGVAYLDATLSGSSGQIRQKTAVFMVGGSEAAWLRCRDVFDAVAGRAIHLGPSGSGAKAKLATNLVLGLNRLVLAEGLAFAGKLGLDPHAFLDLLRVSPAYSRAVDVKGEKMLKGDFRPESKVSQHLKDVRMILDYASRAGQALPLSEVHRDLLAALEQAGDGNLDTSAVLKEIRNRRTYDH